MELAKKYGAVVVLGLVAIIASIAADISDYLSGIVLGFGAAMILFALYKMVSVTAEAKKQEQ